MGAYLRERESILITMNSPRNYSGYWVLKSGVSIKFLNLGIF